MVIPLPMVEQSKPYIFRKVETSRIQKHVLSKHHALCNTFTALFLSIPKNRTAAVEKIVSMSKCGSMTLQMTATYK